jgi:hypothetical protein
LAAKTSLLQAAQFGTENWFAASCTFGNKNYFAAGAKFQQRLLIRCRQFNFSSDSPFRCRAQNSAVNVNSLQTIQFQQRIPNSLLNTQFGSKC